MTELELDLIKASLSDDGVDVSVQKHFCLAVEIDEHDAIAELSDGGLRRVRG